MSIFLKQYKSDRYKGLKTNVKVTLIYLASKILTMITDQRTACAFVTPLACEVDSTI